MIRGSGKIKEALILHLMLLFSFSFSQMVGKEKILKKGSHTFYEFQVKAVFLEKFTRFIEWPLNVLNASKPFVIGVIGEISFKRELSNIYLNQKIKKKKVDIRFVSEGEDISKCHLLFISESVKSRLSKIISLVKDKPILTVSNAKGFARKGVHINIYLRSGRVRFEVNEKAVRDSGLLISYHLLKAAGKIINPLRKRKL